ncbi:MAG: HlyD family type I secretion periplasmic adaptor subunit [Thalassobaculaceae bacterium]|nr:HlyD family type I secretion periplasmic adaptor subunit [Thalassobaculaceae bacterium]
MKSLTNVQGPAKRLPARARRSLVSLNVDGRVGDAGATRLVRAGVFLVGLAVAAFIGWSAVTEVNETAVTLGAVVPTGDVVPVQHLEGGIVEETLVNEGQIVHAGEPVVRLTATSSIAELERMKSRLVSLALEEERLRALAEDRMPEFVEVTEKYRALRDDQVIVLASQIEARDGQTDVLASRIRELQAEAGKVVQDIRNADQIVALLSEEQKIRTGLTKKGLSPRVTLLATNIELADAQGRLDRLKNERERLQQSVRQAREQLEEFRSKFRSEALVQAGKAAAERAEINEIIGSLEDRVQRLVVTSPIHGIVQRLPIKNPGTVLAPGGLVAEIVPVDEELVVENRISPQDVGFVSLGQQVKVKVNTYEFTRLGTIDGSIIYISATTLMDEDDKPYYQGRVRLSKNYVGDLPEHNVLLPGMTVQADITTGRKTIMQYLLKPIYTTINQAMTER